MDKYFRILSRLTNTPLYIDEDKLSILSTNVILPILLSGKPMTDSGYTPTNKQVEVPNQQLAIVKVFDSLVAKGGAGESGFTSYEGIRNTTLNAISKGATKVGFYIDSPGGEASSLFPLTDFISSLPEKYGVETFGFTDGSATSAAYAILASTQRSYATKGSLIGSIGAMMSLVDLTKLDETDGIKYTILRSKEKKAVYNPHEGITPEALAKAKSTLSFMDTMFNEHVTKYRPNLSIDSIVKMEGDHFFAEEALSLGLIDSIVSSIDDVIADETRNTKAVTSNTSFSTTTRGIKMATLDELNTQLSALVQENNTLKESVANAVTKAVTEERVRCADILKAGTELKVPTDLIMKRITAGSMKEDALDVFTAIAEANTNKTAIDTASSIVETLTTTVKEDKLMVGEMSTTASEILNAAKGVK